MSILRGIGVAIRGISRAAQNPTVRQTYFQLVLAVTCFTLVVDALGIWGVLAWTEGGNDIAASLGLWILRVLGILSVLLAAPLLSVFAVNLLLPALAERVFFAAFGDLDSKRAGEIEALDGLGVGASIRTVVRLLVRYLGLTLVAVAISFIPIVGPPIAMIFQLWLVGETLGWELLDPYFSKLSKSFQAQRECVFSHRGSVVGFGCACGMLLAIPVLGPLLFALCQAACASLVVEVIEEDRKPA